MTPTSQFEKSPAKTSTTESVETVVIGGGQAGLATGYYLARAGRPFVILDANQRTGDSWRNRWDSLLLFTPARINNLPGMPFPAPGDSFVGKDAMADYLESYAAKFDLPIRHGARVDRLSRTNGRFQVSAGDQRFESDNVVVAMANFQVPRVPDFARDLDPAIVQVHAHDYRNSSQLREGGVLVVGLGNSGADIAMEVVKTHPSWLAGKESGFVPFRVETFFARNVLLRLVRFVGHHVMSLKTPVGRKMRLESLAGAAPLVRVKPADLVAAGVERVSRIAGVKDGMPVTEDGQVIEVANVVWCTGYRPGFSWIDLPVLGDRQEPMHEAGIVPTEPGLYFVGLHFLYAMTSATITGVSRDAKRIARHIISKGRLVPPTGTAGWTSGVACGTIDGVAGGSGGAELGSVGIRIAGNQAEAASRASSWCWQRFSWPRLRGCASPIPGKFGPCQRTVTGPQRSCLPSARSPFARPQRPAQRGAPHPSPRSRTPSRRERRG